MVVGVYEERITRLWTGIGEISLVDVILPTRQGVEVRKRCISQPTEHQRILLQRLGMKLPMGLEQTQM